MLWLNRSTVPWPFTRLQSLIYAVGANLKDWLMGLRQARELPERIVILLTNPRSGSTWLFDALRCHPAIYAHPSAVIYERLGLVGRRYPRDLSNGLQAKLNIEVTPGQWKRIPIFAVDEGQRFVPAEVMQEPYAIEKCHPHFFKHDVQALLRNISELEKKASVRILYQVRDPKSSMVSFLRYQERNPSWNPHISQEQLPQHMRRIYDSILRTALGHSGLVVDYAELISDFRTTTVRVLDYLWPGKTSAANGWGAELIDLMAVATARDKRIAEGTPFLGGRPGPISGNDGDYEHFFSAYAEEVDRCYQAYRSLLQLRLKRWEETDR